LGLWEEIEKDSRVAADFVRKLTTSVAHVNGIYGTGVFLEFPRLSEETAHLPASFVLIPSERFSSAEGSPVIFEKHFNSDQNGSCVYFSSEHGDGTLVSPRPSAVDASAARHISAFMLNAPVDIKVELFSKVASLVIESYEDKEDVYVSTAGLAVPWLHVRIFTTPKYYNWKENQ